jgi:hypothetical protein
MRIAWERQEQNLGTRPLDAKHAGERDTVQFATSEIHAGHQHADAGVGFYRVQRRDRVIETDCLDTGGAERGHSQVARCLVVVRHQHGSGHSRTLSLPAGIPA